MVIYASIVLVSLATFFFFFFFFRKETNNERIDTDGFHSSSLITAWEEVFLIPLIE